MCIRVYRYFRVFQRKRTHTVNIYIYMCIFIDPHMWHLLECLAGNGSTIPTVAISDRKSKNSRAVCSMRLMSQMVFGVCPNPTEVAAKGKSNKCRNLPSKNEGKQVICFIQ